MLWQPRDEEIEAALARLGTNAVAPGRPALHQRGKAQQAHDFRIGALFEQANRSPIAVEPPHRQLAGQQCPELRFIDIVVPHISDPV